MIDLVDLAAPLWPECTTPGGMHLFDESTDAPCSSIECLKCRARFIVVPFALVEQLRKEAP